MWTRKESRDRSHDKRCEMRRTERNFRNLVSLSAIFLLLLLAVGAPTANLFAKSSSDSVVVVNFNVPVDPGSSALMKRVVGYAIDYNASAIVMMINTPGGLLGDMISIISSISTANQSGIPTYTFVVPNGLAASAGSYIAMATNRILMGPGSAIGPSTPIVVGGSALEQNHTQAAMLKLMTSLAEKWGRNRTMAYNMVQADEAFSSSEAVEYHLVNGFADSLDAAIGILGLSGKQQVVMNEDLYEQFISALSNPILDGILMLLGVLAIAVDIYHPTIILTVVGVVAVVAGLAGAEVINASLLGFLIIALAAFLILLELKLGHGFAMMAGVALGAFGILFLAQGLSYSPSPLTALAELELFLVVVVGIVAGLYFRWIIGPIRRRSKLTGPEAIVGQTGVAMTDLEPYGDVRVGGIIWRAESASGKITKGESVRVGSIRDLVVEVERA
jgi:membrane-bound serine protease (ClpP class)